MNEIVKADEIKIDETEFNVAVEESKKTGLTYTHKFKEGFEYQGKTYNELTFDFGKLTGKDGMEIENEIQEIKKNVIVPAFSGEYLIRLAAKACTEKIGSDALEIMRLHDHNKIRSQARSFLLKSE